jgi:PAS domain S-box-containing protein
MEWLLGVMGVLAALAAVAACRLRRTSARVATNEARHRALFTLMPSGAVVIAADGTFLEFNEQAHTTLGWSREEFAALTLRDLDAAEVPGDLEERLRRLAPGELLEFEGSFRNRPGEPCDVMIRARSAEGWARPAVLVTFLDLTARRRAEQALRTAHRAVLALSRCNEMLVRSTTERALYENLCRLIVEDGGYRMCWVGLAEQDERRSVRAVAVAGHDDGYVAGLGVVWADADLGRGPTGTAIRTGSPSVGRDFAADSNLAPWRAAALARGYRSAVALPLVSEGQAFGAVTIYATEADAFDDAELHFLMQLAEDVSFGVLSLRARADRDRLTSQLVQTDRLASMGTLAAGVAHEINNPLAYVVASHAFMGEALARLRERVADPALGELAEVLGDAREGAERVRQIVRDLRTFSRVDEARTGPVDLHRVLESSLGIAHNELRHRARVVKEYGRTPAVVANEAKLGQVFLNLLINAAQAIEAGKVEENEIRISTSTDERGRARVEISDTGPGIPPELRDRIFEPFFSTKRIGEGTGLGLSICRNIVQAAGGEITVEPGRGRGATLRVVLPAAPPAARPPTPVPPTAASAGRRGRVAVVDDEPAIRRVAERLLADEHDVVPFEGARPLAERIRAGERFDAILCDLLMPDMTGMDLHRLLCELDPGQADAMVFVTGGAFTTEGRAFIDAVQNPVLEKPFDTAAVRRAVRALVR